MRPDEAQAREEAAWNRFLEQLGERLAEEWPAVRERLADRYDAFVAHAVQQARAKGLVQAAALARWANLCVVWGPSFHERAGFEWASARLAAAAHDPWLGVHQLVQRSLTELGRRPDARIPAAALAAADARLIDRFANAGRAGAMAVPQAETLPRAACDLEAAELRLPDGAALQRYECVAGEWQRVRLPAPAPLRIGTSSPAPPMLGLLAADVAAGRAPATLLQARLRMFACCDGDRHPTLGYAGSHGLWRWQGHETRALSWPLAPLAQPGPVAGAATAIAEETAPDICRIDIEVCGLRDEGEPIGRLQIPVWVWPATQWWVELLRQAPPAGAVREGAEPARGTTRCRVEADGAPQDAAPIEQAFSGGLDGALAAARVKLLRSWRSVAGLVDGELEGILALLDGRAAFSWGWTPGPRGLAGRAAMRVCGRAEMAAVRVDLAFSGRLEHAGASARASLHIRGEPAWRHELDHEGAGAELLQAVLPLVTRFSLPVQATLEPLASDDGALLQADGSATGSLVGEAGLRPRQRGGSGWEWFAGLRLEPVSLPVSLRHPLLGSSASRLALLPALTLVDWSLG